MRVKLVIAGAVVAWSCCWAAVPSVTNVRASQRAGTPYVDIGYDLSGSGTDLDVTLAVSTNGGAVYFTPASGLSGDVGRGIAQGAGKKIVWNAGIALSPALYSNVRVKVAVGDAPDGMVLIPAGTNSGVNPLGRIYQGYLRYTNETYNLLYPQSYSLTVEAFHMDVTEVTKAQWDAVYAWAVANGYSFDNAGSGVATNYPVQTVDWYDCVKWCNARSEMDGRTPCYTVRSTTYKVGQNVPDCNFSADGFRLPTNTEWEYAARGGLSSRRFPWGDVIDHSCANYYCKCFVMDFPLTPTPTPEFDYDVGYWGWDSRFFGYTSPVGCFVANRFGLFDMVGNVAEWCWDAWDMNGNSYRGVRGGSVVNSAANSRCGFCDHWWPSASDAEGPGPVGFRTVCR